ncbi:SpoIIE family protein phosphatase [Actinomadura fulvescens]|uniref:Uncharacterized protein n=1 Tax=Actinomadura fulvescens TaxID=46160 RepID=A0ABN3PC00_9ACTN
MTDRDDGAADLVRSEVAAWQELARRQARNEAAGLRLATAGRPGELSADDDVRGDVRGVPGWMAGALAAVPTGAIYVEPVRASDGRIVDLVVRAANKTARLANGEVVDRLVGRRLLDISPGLLLSGVFGEYVRAYETGQVFHRSYAEYPAGSGGQGKPVEVTVRAAPLHEGLLVSWQYHGDADRLSERWSLAERLVGLGWGEWNLITDDVVWTPRLYEVYDRDPADGPLRLDQLPKFVVPEDLPAVQERIRALFEQRTPVDGEYRIRGRHGTRHLRVLHEPVPDASGRTVAIRTLAMDVSEQRRAAQALDETREEVLRERRRVEEERRIARRLRRALLPVREGLIEFPGLRVAVRYLAGEPGRVGGDWWKARRLPDGRVLLAIGDAMGHGLEATTMMTAMRAGLAGLAYTGAGAPQLATWLNELVNNMVPGEIVTGTAALGHVDPESRELAWTSAGHPPPVLVRDGRARLLDHLPHGPMLGVLDEPEFPLTTTALEPGDIVLFYTDGILDRQGRDRDELTEAMLDAVQSVARRVRRDTGDAADPVLAVERVMQALDAEESADDICVMAVQVR